MPVGAGPHRPLDDTVTRCLDDMAGYAVLDAKQSFVLQGNDLVAGVKAPDAIVRFEVNSFPDDPTLNQPFACQGVEQPLVTT